MQFGNFAGSYGGEVVVSANGVAFQLLIFGQ